MKIINDINRAENSRTPDTPDKSAKNVSKGASGSRDVSSLSPGDKFRAGIVNITSGGVTLKLEGGALLTAKTLSGLDARIGDNAVFQVTESFKGQILLEMLKPDAAGNPTQATVSGGVLRGALLSADMPLTNLNMQLVQNLVGEGMPIDPKTLQTAAFFMYSDPSLTFEQIKFLLIEGFPADVSTIETLKAILDKSLSLNKNIGELISAAAELTDKDLRGEFLRFLALEGLSESLVILNTGTARHITGNEVLEDANNEPAENITPSLSGQNDDVQNLVEAAKNKLYFDLDGKGLENASKIYKELEKTAALLSALVKDKGGSPKMEKALDDIGRNLAFMSRIHNSKEYMQIPFRTENQKNEAELHLFKKKKRPPENSGQSALVALDYPELKRVEVLITKNQKAVTLQFSAETTKILNLLGGNMYQLNDALAAAGYSVAGLSFKKLKEPSSVVSLPAGPDCDAVKKYSVDVRV